MGLGDAFGKDSGGEDGLDYDDGAFFYLAFSLSSCLAVYFLGSVFFTWRAHKKSKYNCYCDDCTKLNESLVKPY